MATYKVIQDIEAEDKLVGPLSFRQFVYFLITAFCVYICVVCITHNVGFLAILFLPPGLFTGFLAFPFGKDQPTEVWALAKLRFLIKPHSRIWNQSGVKEMVTVTAPKKIEVVRTNGLDQSEVRSRLRALADTIDSRGWAIKNVNVNMYSQPSQPAADASDRLINIANLPQEVPNYDVQASDDILDEQSNPIAQQMDQMINASTSAHRQQLIQELNTVQQPSAPTAAMPNAPAVAPADYWFLQANQVQAQQPAAAQAMVTPTQQLAQPAPGPIPSPTPVGITPADEQALLEKLRAQNNSPQAAYAHLKTIQPIGAQQQDIPQKPVAEPLAQSIPFVPAPPAFTARDPVGMPITDTSSVPYTASAAVTAAPDPAILALANNNDLNVATLARQAHRAKVHEEQSSDEVVISLH